MFDSKHILRLAPTEKNKSQYEFEVCNHPLKGRCQSAFLSSTGEPITFSAIEVKNYHQKSYYQNLLSVFSTTSKNNAELIAAGATAATAPAVYHIIPLPKSPVSPTNPRSKKLVDKLVSEKVAL